MSVNTSNLRGPDISGTKAGVVPMMVSSQSKKREMCVLGGNGGRRRGIYYDKETLIGGELGDKFEIINQTEINKRQNQRNRCEFM